MRMYLDTFWDLYWDMHLGVRGDGIPDQVREIGASFNAVLAYRDPTQKIVYDNYMTVRKHLAFLKSWIDDRLADIESGKTREPETTFAWYWLRNGADSEYFNHQDVVFECFHNFVAFSQWGNSLYNVMANLGREGGDPQAKDWFAKTTAGDFDKPDGSAFPPLERFVMELFRTISPNGGSISALDPTRPPAFERHGYIATPHPTTSRDPVQWSNPDDFDPARYQKAPTSQDIDEARIRQMGLANCPFTPTDFAVSDGRQAALRNSAFGTVFGVVDNQPKPVCDYAGFAPFGFGYRRCPGEQLTADGIRRPAPQGGSGPHRVRQGRRGRRGEVADRSQHRDRRRHRIRAAVVEKDWCDDGRRCARPRPRQSGFSGVTPPPSSVVVPSARACSVRVVASRGGCASRWLLRKTSRRHLVALALRRYGRFGGRNGRISGRGRGNGHRAEQHRCILEAVQFGAAYLDHRDSPSWSGDEMLHREGVCL